MGEFSWFDDDVSDGPALSGRGNATLASGRSPAVDRAIAARGAVWAQLGDLDSDVLAHALNPAFLGGPEWPALRESFVRVRRSDSVVLASDGLSDPHREAELAEPGLSGFGVEVFIETADPGLLRTGIGSIVDTWAFALLYEMAQNVAFMGDLAERIERLGIVSMEIPEFPMGSGWETADGSVGVLLGVPARGFPECVDTGAGNARLVAVTLLRPAELDHVVTGRAAGRAEIAQRLAALGCHHRCDLSRPPVV